MNDLQYMAMLLENALGQVNTPYKKELTQIGFNHAAHVYPVSADRIHRDEGLRPVFWTTKHEIYHDNREEKVSNIHWIGPEAGHRKDDGYNNSIERYLKFGRHKPRNSYFGHNSVLKIALVINDKKTNEHLATIIPALYTDILKVDIKTRFSHKDVGYDRYKILTNKIDSHKIKEESTYKEMVDYVRSLAANREIKLTKIDSDTNDVKMVINKRKQYTPLSREAMINADKKRYEDLKRKAFDLGVERGNPEKVKKHKDDEWARMRKMYYPNPHYAGD